MNPVQFNKVFGYLGNAPFCYVIPKKCRLVEQTPNRLMLINYIEKLGDKVFLRVNINLHADYSFVLQSVVLNRKKSNALLVSAKVLEQAIGACGLKIDSLLFYKEVLYCPLDKLKKQKARKDIALKNSERNAKVRSVTFATKKTSTSLLDWATENKKDLDKKKTQYEKILYRALYKTFKQRIKTQHPYLINGHLYYADIAIPSLKLIIEVDGGYHITKERKTKDLQRDADFKSVGYTTLRYTNEQVASKEGRQRIVQTILNMQKTN